MSAAQPLLTAEPVVGPALAEDHHRLEGLFKDLENASAANVDIRTLGRVWRAYEDGLLAHMKAEEEFLFDALKASHPFVLTTLREQHEAIRKLLTAMDIAIDLHFVRHHQVQEMLSLVREHAALENETLYGWADKMLTPDQRVALTKALHKEAPGKAVGPSFSPGEGDPHLGWC